MPVYATPGVYVEETSHRAKSIEGVSTSITGFVGPTRKGPFRAATTIPDDDASPGPELLTSFSDFERIYGGLENLDFGGTLVPNYLAYAVRAYFDNGGSQLYVSRAYLRNGTDPGLASTATDAFGVGVDLSFNARFPGVAGNGRVQVELVNRATTGRVLRNASVGTVAAIQQTGTWSLTRRTDAGWEDPAGDPVTPQNGDPVEILSLEVRFRERSELHDITADEDEYGGPEAVWENLGLDPGHPRWIGTVLAAEPDRRIDQVQNMLSFDPGSSSDGFDVLAALFGDPAANEVANGTVSLDPVPLSGGLDGISPDGATSATALLDLRKVEQISIVAAPAAAGDPTNYEAVRDELITHVSGRRAYRIAVIDSLANETPSTVAQSRSRIDSKYAAFYYPWVVVANPLARPNTTQPREIALPPSGFVCGIYARNDVERGAAKAPGNEVVRGALRFESHINFAQQGSLNPQGVNCLRFFPGRGNRLWGARLASLDPDWKYVSDRRYLGCYLAASIDRGTQWAVFEANGERLWANVRQTVSDFLYNEWFNGNLLGASTEEAYFVRCDRSTMTQNDLDNGRLVCEVGVAILRPAEFVIFRIGQKTADA